MARRLIVIGLDGVGLDLARRLADEGVMPHLGRLLARGLAWSLDSPLPEVSPVCWTTLFSGADPGAHGVFGFGLPQPGTYQVAPVDASAVALPRLWDDLSAAGRPAVVLNVPLTYPASTLEGAMVSGFVVPELSQAAHPPALAAELARRGYRPEADLDLGRDDPAALAADLAQVLEGRLALFQEMLARPWDLYVAVVTDSDRVNHFLWPALFDPAHPQHAAARALYTRMDDFIGQVWRDHQADVQAGETALLVCADHSFGPIRSEVYLNPWLAQEGWLHTQGPAGAEEILPTTAALALDPGRIHLHWRHRFPGGTLEPGPRAEALMERIRAALLELTFTQVATGPDGAPRLEEVHPVVAVHRGRDLYRGPLAHLGPDLVAQAAPGFSLRAGLDRPGIFGRSHLEGTHRPTGALALWLAAGPPPDPPPSHIGHLHRLMTAWLGPGPVL